MMATKTEQTFEIEGSRFVEMAMKQGLLQKHHAEKILEHAQLHNVRPSDAALTLAMLEHFEVDAMNLLCNPKSLAPGYELTNLIGCGAGGMVFRAHQTALGRDVALKTINQNARNAKTTGEPRIQREAHAIAQLKHPGIVAAIDSGFYQGRFCIAMELVEGETLVDFIERQSPIVERVAWQIARQVACALSHANGNSIIHRDIKPANLLLCEPPTGTDFPADVPCVKVADFGLAFQSSEHNASHITATGTTLGTPAYVAPEQLQDSHVDARADIYSLGSTVYHMLTGRAPCADQSPIRTIMQKTIGEDRWRDDLPDSVSRQTVSLFRDMTEANADDRIESYEVLIARIDELIEQAPIKQNLALLPPRNESAIASSSLSAPRKRVALSIASVLIVCVFVILGVKFGPEQLNLANDQATANWTADGFPQPLFNGMSVPLFRKMGNWSTGVASDGSRVLTGQAGSTMRIPLALKSATTQNLRLRLALSINRQSVAEIGLQYADRESDEALLRFRDGIAEFVSVGDRTKEIDSTSIPLTQSTHDNTVFQRVNVVRGGNQISLICNGQTLGTVPCDPTMIATILLRSTLGTTDFADVDIVTLKREVPQT